MYIKELLCKNLFFNGEISDELSRKLKKNSAQVTEF